MEKLVDEEKYILKWNSHDSIIANNVIEHLGTEELCDVTLSCDGKFIRAHKLILSAASRYFKLIFQLHKERNPVIIMTNTRFEYIQYIIDYIYKGEVKLLSSEIESILKLANDLQIKGLYGVLKKNIQHITKNIQKPTEEKSDNLHRNPSSHEKNPNVHESQSCISTSPPPLNIVIKEEKQTFETTQDKSNILGNKRDIEVNKKQIADSAITSKRRKIAEPQSTPKEKHIPIILRPVLPRPDKVMDLTKPKDTLKSPHEAANPADNQTASPNTGNSEPTISQLQHGTNSTHIRNGSNQKVTNPHLTCEQATSNTENSMDESVTKPLAIKQISAFMLFTEEHRPKVSLEYPGESIKEISLRLSRMWKNLPNKEKDSFYKAASRENEKLKIKMKN